MRLAQVKTLGNITDLDLLPVMITDIIEGSGDQIADLGFLTHIYASSPLYISIFSCNFGKKGKHLPFCFFLIKRLSSSHNLNNILDTLRQFRGLTTVSKNRPLVDLVQHLLYVPR